ncbi:MAG: hypothetical protein WB783_13530 [Arenicellales bacterium]
MKIRTSRGLLLTMAATALLYGSSVLAAGTTVQVQEAEGPSQYSIKLSQSSIPAGMVTFKVMNHSKTLEHEFVVIKTDLAPDKLPYDTGAQRVKENKVDVVGEVDDLMPKTSGTNTFDLKPGKYVAICNQPGHYKLGMYISFTVTK